MPINPVYSSNPKVVSSAFSTVSEGISELKRANKLKEAIDLFDKPPDAGSTVISNKTGNIALEGTVQSPDQYYGQLQPTQPGLVDSNELRKKLNDPRLDIGLNLNSLVKKLTDMRSMESLDDLLMQSRLEKINQLLGMTSNVMKAASGNQGDLARNLKES